MPTLEWDESKRSSNLAKHGLDFDDAKSLDWDNAAIIEDTRFPYPERRFWAFAQKDGRCYIVTFCSRGSKLRIISFRKANSREVRRHGKKA